MLNPVKLKSSFDRVIKKIRKVAFVISFVTLSSLPSFVSRVEAIEPETASNFKGLAKQAMELMDESKVVHPDGSISYNVPESSKRRLEKEFDKIVKKLKKEVDRDIKQQNWIHAERLIGVFYNFLREMGYENSAEDLLELMNKIHDDFVSHVDMNRLGIYTINGSGKVYVISEGSSRMMSLAQSKSRMNASIFLLRYLKVNSAQIALFGISMATNIDEERGIHKFSTLVGFYKGGKVVLDDGTELSEEDIAEMLERDGKFLPLR